MDKNSYWMCVVASYVVFGLVFNVVFYEAAYRTPWYKQIIPRLINVFGWPLGLVGLALLLRAKTKASGGK